MPNTTRRAVQWTLGLWALIRVPVLLFGHPIIWPDSIGYMRLADRLRHWDFAGYNGQRTPGYSLLVLAAGQQPGSIWLVQMALGAAIAVLLFYATFLLTRNTQWSLAAAVAYLVGPHVVIYESSILNETWCTFLTVLSVYLYLRIAGNNGGAAWWAYVSLGVVLGVNVLTRPLQAIVIPLFGLALLPRPWFSREWSRYVRPAASVATAVLVTVAWCGLNRATVGAFTLSTMGGIASLNVTNGFIERSGPEHQSVVDILLPHRAEQIRQTGSGMNLGWVAYSDLKRSTGLTDPELSQELLKLSAAAIKAAPGAWLRVVTWGWIKFWFCPGGLVRDLSGSVVLGVATAAPFILANFCFAGASLFAVVNRQLRRRFSATNGLWLITSIAALASVAQAITEGTSGTRYAIPYQPLFFITLAVVASWFLPVKTDSKTYQTA